MEKHMVKARPPDASLAPTDADPASAVRIVAELDHIIGRSRRRLPLRRGLRRMGGAVGRWLDQLVPPSSGPDDAEPPPQIKFPFF